MVLGRPRLLLPALLAVGIGVVALRFSGDLSAHRTLSGPLGYDNANAQLYLQGAIAALMAAAAWRRIPLRVVGVAAAAALAAATLAINSRAVDVLLLLPVGAVLLRSPRAVRTGVAVAGALVALSLVGSTILGLTYRSGSASSGVGVADRELSTVRPALWHEALVLLRAHPLTGVGPGRFQLASPLARSDRDIRWAHNGFLQQAAEGGVPAFLLVVAAFAWGFVRFWLAPGADRVTALGAASLAALGVQACVDYVLHFPALPMVVAVLVGVASRSPAHLETPG
jgi:O-antigen ligase